MLINIRVPEAYSRNPDHVEFGDEYMPANIVVTGQLRKNVDPLKESQVAFRKHQAEVGDAVLNVSGIGTPNGEPLDKDDPRPPYVHQEWPKVMYHADGRFLEVANSAEMEEATVGSFRLKPYPKVQVAVADPATEKKELLATNRNLQGQIVSQQELIERMEARLTEMENKRGPGRPRKEIE